MMNEMDWMVWGVGLFGLLVIVVLVLSGAALVKYMFFEGRERKDDD